jgi:hypothetical protein
MSLSKDFLVDEAIAATGSTQTDAAQLTANVNLPTAASTDGTKGVKLPAGAVKGTMVAVFNRAGSAVNLKVYSATSAGYIDATAGSTANTIAQTKGKVYFCMGSDNWRTVTGA